MRALGFDVKKADVLKILRDYDRDSTGKIHFDDFKEVSKLLEIITYYALNKGLQIQNTKGEISEEERIYRKM